MSSEFLGKPTKNGRFLPTSQVVFDRTDRVPDSEDPARKIRETARVITPPEQLELSYRDRQPSIFEVLLWEYSSAWFVNNQIPDISGWCVKKLKSISHDASQNVDENG